jgi:hypothetical protein
MPATDSQPGQCLRAYRHSLLRSSYFSPTVGLVMVRLGILIKSSKK